MFFFISKLIHFAIYPITWILTLLVSTLMFRKPKTRRMLQISGLLIYLIFSNPYLYFESMRAWEGDHSPIQTHLSTTDVIIILGGFSSWNEERGVSSYNESSERLIRAVQLYREGAAPAILMSGGSGLIGKPEEREGAWVKQDLLAMGIPESAIWVDPASRNTYENAMLSKRLLESNNHPGSSCYLVTSAYHMRRAKAVFEKVGFEVIPYPVDFQSDRSDHTFRTYVIPSLEILGKWGTLFHEWIGYLVYQIKGFI